MRSLDLFEATGLWLAVSGLALVWLAVFFGRTLRGGRVPLIQRIAQVSDPALSPDLCRYTRRLTAIWCGYFVAASVLSLIAAVLSTMGHPVERTGLVVWSGTAVLFVAEHWLRPRLFPGRMFPGLWQQVRDTWSVWHPRP